MWKKTRNESLRCLILFAFDDVSSLLLQTSTLKLSVASFLLFEIEMKWHGNENSRKTELKVATDGREKVSTFHFTNSRLKLNSATTKNIASSNGRWATSSSSNPGLRGGAEMEFSSSSSSSSSRPEILQQHCQQLLSSLFTLFPLFPIFSSTLPPLLAPIGVLVKKSLSV